MTVLGVNGAAGRMGQAVVETAADRTDVEVAFGIDTETDTDTDTDADLTLYEPSETASALGEHDPDVVVDFTLPEATVDLAEACSGAGAGTGVGLVVGTTGFGDDQLATLREVSGTVPLLKATNFSRGIQGLLCALGPALDALPGYDVEVMETHHNRKRDAPSGTANTIVEEIARHRDVETVYGREGIQPREDGEVGVLVRRAGDVRGEHEVTVAGNDEVLTIGHRAEDRAVFAAGALDAAVWLADSDPGWYSFGDVVTGG